MSAPPGLVTRQGRLSEWRAIRRCGAVTVVALSLAAPMGRAQGLVESADGSTSIMLKSGAQGSVNFSDKSIRFGLVQRVSNRWLLYGGEIKLTATDGVANVVKSGFHPLQLHVALTVGSKRDDTASANYQQLVVQVAGDYQKMNLADTAGGPAINHPTTTLLSATAYYNLYLGLGGRVSGILGLSGGYGGRSNYADLDQVQLCTQVASQGAKSLTKCDDARLGPATSSNALSGALDVVIFPGFTDVLSVLAFTGFARVNPASDSHDLVPGLGLLFSKRGAPLSVVGGLTIEFGQVTRIGVQAGVPF